MYTKINHIKEVMLLSNLLCVKSIMTIILSIGLCIFTYLYPNEMLDTFKSCVTMVVTFYFTHQLDKTRAERESKKVIENGGENNEVNNNDQ